MSMTALRPRESAFRPNAALVTVVLLAGCAESITLTPLAREHLREGYRRPLRGSAVVLPVLDCNAVDASVQMDIEARQLSAVFFPGEIWHQLGLPNPPREGRVQHHEKICKELLTVGSGANDWMASPYMRERLREYLDRFSGRKWLVIVARTLLLDATSGLQSGLPRETATARVSTFIYSGNGEIAFRSDLECNARGTDPLRDCGQDFREAPKKISAMLEGFPRPILEDAGLVNVIAPEDEEIEAPVPAIPASLIVPPTAAEPPPPAAAIKKVKFHKVKVKGKKHKAKRRRR